MESLKSLFRCYICMEKVKNARLCPHCSKLCCLHCIRCWIIDQHHSFCPHCRMPMTLMKFVNCRWAEEATQQLTTLQVAVDSISQNLSPPDSTICHIHKEKLSVYCNTCDDVICHECALWDKRHSGHNFQPLDEVYRKHILQIESQIAKLKTKLLDIFTYIKIVDKNMEDIKTAKDEGIKELNNALEHMINRLDLTMKKKMCSLEFVKRQMHYEMDRLDTFLQKMGSELGVLSKADTIKRISQIVGAFDQLLQAPGDTISFLTRIKLAKFPDNQLISTNFPSEVVPPFDSAVFVIEDFPKARYKAEPIYSEPLNVFGLVWRLKIYPDGNGAVRGQYLSVFLELTSCVYGSHLYKAPSQIDEQTGERNQEVTLTDPSEQNRSTNFDSLVDPVNFCKEQILAPSKYEYRVEMINQKRPSTNLSDKAFSNVQLHDKTSLRLNKTQYHQHFPSASHSFLPTVDDGSLVNNHVTILGGNFVDESAERDSSNKNYLDKCDLKEVKRNIVREFASDFEVGECWGYNRFFRLALLESEGFLADGRTLELKFSVRPPTFYQACRDRDRYIKYLENQIGSFPDNDCSQHTPSIYESRSELKTSHHSAFSNHIYDYPPKITAKRSKKDHFIEIGGQVDIINKRSDDLCRIDKASTSKCFNIETDINSKLVNQDRAIVKLSSLTDGRRCYKLELNFKPHLLPLLLDLNNTLPMYKTLTEFPFFSHYSLTLFLDNVNFNKVIDIFIGDCKVKFHNQTLRKSNTTERHSRVSECNSLAALELPKRPTALALMDKDEKFIRDFVSSLCRHCDG